MSEQPLDKEKTLRDPENISDDNDALSDYLKGEKEQETPNKKKSEENQDSNKASSTHDDVSAAEPEKPEKAASGTLKSEASEKFSESVEVNQGDEVKKMQASIFWSILFIVAIVGGIYWVVSPYISGSKKEEKQATAQAKDNSYLREMKDNLKRLTQGGVTLKPSVRLASSKSWKDSAYYSAPLSVPPRQPRVDKAYIARRNAPTQMYLLPHNTTTSSETISAANSSGFHTLGEPSSNAAFANQQSVASAVMAKKIAHPSYTIAAGGFMHAILETAINSDLPGQVRAIVTRPVYAYMGEKPLIPAGSRVIGQYASTVVEGQNRVMIVWNRLILPQGISVQIDSTSTDALGRAGQGADSVNTHFFARFGKAILLSVLSAGAANIGVNSDTRFNSASAYRQAIAQSLTQTANSSLKSSSVMKPTLHIYQGAKINVFVAHDVSFYDVLHEE